MRFTLFFVAFAVAFPTAPAGAITFDDGMVHVIDAGNSYPLENVFVFNSTTGAATTVNLVEGGAIGSELFNQRLELHEDSIGNITGGLVWRVTAEDSASLFISGGAMQNGLVADDAHAHITGGAFGEFGIIGSAQVTVLGGSGGRITVTGNADTSLTIFGGTLTFVTITEAGRHLIRGGTITDDVEVNNHGRLRLRGGEVAGDLLGGGTAIPSWIEIAGGTIAGQLQNGGNSDWVIMGGTFLGQLIMFGSNGSVTIRGSNFNYPLGIISVTSGTLTGTLGDGTLLSLPFTRSSGATITLACGLVGSLSSSTAMLAADQANICEDWSGVAQSGSDLSRAELKFADLSQGDLSSSILVDTDLLFADLSGADLSGADVSGTDFFGARYDESTLFPSGQTIYVPPWGLDGGITPWDAGMIFVPEPSLGLLQLFAAATLIGLAAMKRSGETASPNARSKTNRRY